LSEKFKLGVLAAMKWIKQLIREYNGPPDGLRDYLLKKLDEKEAGGNLFMADLAEESFMGRGRRRKG